MPRGYFIPFTEAQKQQIKGEYLTKPLNELAREVNATSPRIKRFLERNDLKIPKALLQKRIQDSYKKKGDTAYNKGLKQEDYMSAEALAKSAKTRFKKGNIPHNILQIYTERETKDGYIEVKIKNPNIWVLKQRLVYEKHHKIQLEDSEIVIFKDKNNRNFTVTNLKRISKEENMLRNSKHHFPQEIIPTMALLSQMNNKIKTLENGTK
jgi:hypothetical protein